MSIIFTNFQLAVRAISLSASMFKAGKSEVPCSLYLRSNS